jgi:NAD(P)-dependent dehydrogenase (short-subunit alcohol dehydrogenase family)
MKQFDPKNKIALVTGANRGIGKAFVTSLVQRGARKVYAATRDASTFSELRAVNKNIVEPVLLDVTQTDQIQALRQKIPELDLLINNAGIATACASSAENASKVAQLEMNTNYFGPLNIILALLPALKKSQGAIVNIASIVSISNFPSLGPYSATKAALHSLTEGLRTELAAAGILVAGVYPGPIDTRMTENFPMEKAPPSQVAERTLDGLKQGEVTIFPDAFAEQMYALFLKHPRELEKAFAAMHT